MKIKYLLLILFFVNTFQHQAQINSHIVIPYAERIDTDLTMNKSIYSIVNFKTPTYTIQNQTINNGSNMVANGALAYDTAILKFDTNFLLNHYFHFSGSGSEAISVVHEDDNNNLYAIIEANGPVTIDNTTYPIPASGYQSLIIKINSNGQVAWVKKVDQDLAQCKIKTINNEVFIAGRYIGMSLKIENTTVLGNQVHSQLSETFIAKFNATNGSLQWLRSSETTSGVNQNKMGTHFVDLELDQNGNAVLIANLFSPAVQFGTTNVSFVTNNASNNAVTVIAKYSNAGNLSWAKAPTVMNNRLLLAEDLDIDATNNIYISANATGGVNYWGTSVNPSFTTTGMYGHLFKLNASGNFQWAKANTNIQGGLTIYGIKCVKNDIIVTYRALNPQIIDNQTINISKTSSILAVFGNNGALKNYKLLVPDNSDPNLFSITNILHYNSAGYILSGNQYEDIILDNSYSMPMPNPAIFDNIFIIKSGEFASSKKIVVDKWKIYPNPAKDKVFVEGEELSLKYKIYDLSGRIVDANSLTNSRIDLSNLSNGIYIVELTNDEFTQSIKIIKE
ncbi:T9SS type A sorting domain-containing protein [Paenimyroides aestuarii]|uniref:T9SS type A sorting domain-containing protein n=1 Tax=Paenimyroides aestuarii TaxID=2968490 RepID=A0ABY5NTG3_9FLAO|nr:T9SS type A sorting domain-containing protein [Paenimyroides aestuarii]UUV21862.1 T9SS type A sorting domain-containing protein [Paenimyroides aestuarii]